MGHVCLAEGRNGGRALSEPALQLSQGVAVSGLPWGMSTGLLGHEGIRGLAEKQGGWDSAGPRATSGAVDPDPHRPGSTLVGETRKLEWTKTELACWRRALGTPGGIG